MAMNKRKLIAVGMVAALLIAATLIATLSGPLAGRAKAAPADSGSIFYESRPDEVALYLSDIAFARDTVTLPGGQEMRVLLPAGTIIDTLMLTENGQRVRNYRLTSFNAETMSYMSATGSYVLTWDPVDSAAETREVTLEYMLPGAHWTPTYDMDIVDNENVRLAFFAEVFNITLDLDDAQVYLVAGRVSTSEQVDQQVMMMTNQAVAGYQDIEVSVPAMETGAVAVQHVYDGGRVTADAGDHVYLWLLEENFAARRVILWHAANDTKPSTIYKVNNSSDLPLAQGIVRVYEDGIFTGSDYIETTPVGSEGSITVGNLPELRVNRTETQEYTGNDDIFQHNIALEMTNHTGTDLDVVVVDAWNGRAWEFSYNMIPTTRDDNLLRWEITVPANSSLTITYQYLKDHY